MQNERKVFTMKDFCEIFKALRKEKGLTQDQIAEILGTSPQTISR